MDLYLTLSVGVWAIGGVFSSAWLFWLDRERREIGFPFKAATILFWPVSLPVLLHERGDLTGWEAGRNALLWLALLSPGVTLSLIEVNREPRVEVRYQYVRPPAVRPARVVPAVDPEPIVIAAVPSENDKREAIRYWNSGIIYYQRGDYEKARDEWGRCMRLDPGNFDCKTGLGRIEQSYGGPAEGTATLATLH